MGGGGGALANGGKKLLEFVDKHKATASISQLEGTSTALSQLAAVQCTQLSHSSLHSVPYVGSNNLKSTVRIQEYCTVYYEIIKFSNYSTSI
jgi:hypothetical protein